MSDFDLIAGAGAEYDLTMAETRDRPMRLLGARGTTVCRRTRS
jgi:hypothetical protein